MVEVRIPPRSRPRGGESLVGTSASDDCLGEEKGCTPFVGTSELGRLDLDLKPSRSLLQDIL